MRWTVLAAAMALAACSGGDEAPTPASSAAPNPGVAAGETLVPDAKILAFLSAGATPLPPARCRQPDGSQAPQPGFIEAAMDDKSWGPELAALDAGLSDGDRSVTVAGLSTRRSVMATVRCSPNDLFWTHLSLVGITETVAPILKDGTPAETEAAVRGYRLTPRGRKTLPPLIRALAARR